VEPFASVKKPSYYDWTDIKRKWQVSRRHLKEDEGRAGLTKRLDDSIQKECVPFRITRKGVKYSRWCTLSGWGGRSRSSRRRGGSSRWRGGWVGEGDDTVVWAIAPLGMVRAGHDDSARRGVVEFFKGERLGGCGAKFRRLLVENWCPFYTSEAQLPAPLFIFDGSASRSSTRRGRLGASCT
jgi:hypothetical protein